MNGCGPPCPPRPTGLRRAAPDVLCSGNFWTLANLELHGVALSQIGNRFAADGALMKEVFLALVVLE